MNDTTLNRDNRLFASRTTAAGTTRHPDIAGWRLKWMPDTGSKPGILSVPKIAIWFFRDPIMQAQKRREVTVGDMVKGAVAGWVGGLAGSLAMTQIQDLLFSRADPRKKRQEIRHSQQPLQPDTPTEIVADKISQAARGEPLSEEYKPAVGEAVHIGYGVAMGGVYGALAEVVPQVSRGLGVPWGVGVWLITNEIGLTVLKLSPPPHKHPPRVHLTALGLHVVYGLVTYMVCARVRSLLERGVEALRPGAPGREPQARRDYPAFAAAGI